MYYMHVSPTVARYKSVRFMIRTNDHPPPHVVIEIQTGNVVRSHGFSQRDVVRLVKEVLATKDLLQEEWDAIHEQE